MPAKIHVGIVFGWIWLVGACRAAPQPRTLLEAELDFIAPYAATLDSGCGSGQFMLALSDRENAVILTDPPVGESSWQLATCDHDIKLTLDCRMMDAGVDCRSHEWPVPRPIAAALARELKAAFAAVPKCPPDRSCEHGHRCAEDGVNVRRLSRYQLDAPTQYEVTRCGQTVHLAIRCPEEAPLLGCHVDVVTPAGSTSGDLNK